MIKKEKYPFVLPKLNYTYEALEPYIDKETMYIHHEKHLGTYINKLNKVLEDYPECQDLSLEDMLDDHTILPDALLNDVITNGGGVFNHEFYFSSIGEKKNQPIPEIIVKAFGSEEEFKKEMKDAAMSRVGSGFIWLVQNADKEFSILSLANQETPFFEGINPILVLDVWEHAYYLKYQNLRGNYVDNWFSVIDWENVEKRIKR